MINMLAVGFTMANVTTIAVPVRVPVFVPSIVTSATPTEL